MKCKNYFLASVLVLSLTTCGQQNKSEDSVSLSMTQEPTANDERQSENMATEDISSESSMAVNQKIVSDHTPATKVAPVLPNFIASLGASTANDDGIHKFIRTVRLKFKVQEVAKATYNIEQVLILNKGFIIKSSITSSDSQKQTSRISDDSLLVQDYYNLTSEMELRVPNQLLDTVLRQLAPLAMKVDYRLVEAEDVTLKLMAEQLKKERLAKKQTRVANAIGNTGQRLNDVMDAESVLDYTQEQKDQSVLDTYLMNDRIAYSTIYVSLYQDAIQQESVVASQKEYKPSLGSQAVNALSNGWWMLSTLGILLLNIWPILLVVAAGVVVCMRYKRKREND